MKKTDDSPEVIERFKASLDLVEVIARQMGRTVGPVADLGDLLSYGREGLLDAARRFDPERGVAFRSYAGYRVRGAIADGLRSLARLPRRLHIKLKALEAGARFNEGALEDVSQPAPPGQSRAAADQVLSEHLAGMASAMALGLVAESAHGEDGEAIGVAHNPNPEEALGNAELIHLVRDAIESLPDEEAMLVRRHYLEGERFDVVAADLGLSKSWASRLHTRAVAKLTKRLKGAAG